MTTTELQRGLTALGYIVTIDGKLGPETHRAIMSFQRARGLPMNGLPDAATCKAISLAVPAEMPAPAPQVDPLFDPIAFEAAMIDRRADHTPMVKIKGKSTPYDPPPRHWTDTTGVTLHQTACNMGERIERYDTIGAHYAVLRSGRVLRMCDNNRIVYHGNGWNSRCVGIEVDGLYAGLESDPIRTTWDNPSTPIHERAQQVTPEAMLATRNLVRWIRFDVGRNGGTVTALVAHRQSSLDRRDDPGEAIWRAVALPLHAELGLDDGGVGFKIGGYAIPEGWDERCRGIAY